MSAATRPGYRDCCGTRHTFPHAPGCLQAGHNARMAKKKRGYSRAFTPRSDRRLKFEADRVPPTLFNRVTAKIRRENAAGRPLSLRSLILTLLEQWAAKSAVRTTVHKDGQTFSLDRTSSVAITLDEPKKPTK